VTQRESVEPELT